MEALGTAFVSGEEAFLRSGWDGLYAATVFNACGGFFFPKPACVLFEAVQTLNIQDAVRQGASWFESMLCTEIAPVIRSSPSSSSMG